ncbi:mannosyl-N-acetyl-alpha-D-glucosaminyl-diphospho-ditrans,octacis-undecaprenol 3-alpha-mannosyltransferase / alpha-1,3-rhamnosyltransferase [Gammaproteobacteria bacterium]
MHIGFDISQTGASRAGCGFFAYAMLTGLLRSAPNHCYSLFPSFGDFYLDPWMPFQNPHPGKNVKYGPRHFSRAMAGMFWSDDALEQTLGRPDVIHANNFWCPLQLNVSRLIYTFYDMGFAVNPDWTTEMNRVGCFDGVFRASLAADWIVAISQASRKHYLNVFPHFPAERIRVISPCSRFITPTAEGQYPKALDGITPGMFWLTVGTIEPRKNQLRLVEAYVRYLAAGGLSIPLVFVGGKGWLMDDFQKRLRIIGLDTQVKMLGYVSDDELIWLYRHCFANLYPSLFEGFGLPVLEGMQFGAPTLASRSSSIPEVVGDAGILLDPEDVEAWTQAMLRLTTNRIERDTLSSLSKRQAERFDWKNGVALLLELYQEAITTPKRRVIA